MLKTLVGGQGLSCVCYEVPGAPPKMGSGIWGDFGQFWCRGDRKEEFK